MTPLLLAPAVLCAVLLAAHFYRAGHWFLVALALGVCALLLVRKAWAARIVQSALLLGSIEWLRTLAELVLVRQAMGAPWLRLALVLGAVAAATLLSALVFRSRTLRSRYGLDEPARGRRPPAP